MQEKGCEFEDVKVDTSPWLDQIPLLQQFRKRSVNNGRGLGVPSVIRGTELQKKFCSHLSLGEKCALIWTRCQKDVVI